MQHNKALRGLTEMPEWLSHIVTSCREIADQFHREEWPYHTDHAIAWLADLCDTLTVELAEAKHELAAKECDRIIRDALTAVTDDTTITRVEVIDHREGTLLPGRCFSARDCAVELSQQDSGRTLKVFVTSRTPR